MKRIYFTHLLFLMSCLMFLWPKAQASHIIGSSMSYTCMGNNQYKITLEVYKDNHNTQPDFDEQAIIGVYTCGNNISCKNLTQTDVVLTAISALDTSYEFLPPNYPNGKPFNLTPTLIGFYHFNITLPENEEPYYIIHQRYSNNQTILNVDIGGFYGIISMLELKPEVNSLCNTSPMFHQPPLSQLCLNYEMYFDYGASEPDGDSLSYSFFNPFAYYSDDPIGIVCGSTFPEPPCPPPFDLVGYNNKYPSEKPFGLNIDDQNFDSSGVLHVNPKYTIGNYLTGIKVSEYRNGNLLSTTYRTMITNVILCLWTDTKSEEKQESITIVPNPGKDQVNLIMNQLNPEIAVLHLSNIQGKLVLNKIVQPGSNFLDVSSLPKGIYFYQIIENGGLVSNGKLVLTE